MKTLYLMRHGQTLFNLQHKIQGWCDSPLTENGKQHGLMTITFRLMMLIAAQVKEQVTHLK